MNVYEEIDRLDDAHRSAGPITSGWTIPPPQMDPMQRPWVDWKTFQQRLEWATQDFFKSSGLFTHQNCLPQSSIFLSGSLIPLCFLQHQVDTLSRERFLLYANEVYAGRDIDIFLIGLQSEEPIRQFLDKLSTARPERLEWKDCFGRSGISFTLRSTPTNPWDVHIIWMDPQLTSEQVFSKQHFPFVRAWWDGTTLRATKDCVESWLSRCCTTRALFDDTMDPLRRSRNVLKFAMRGFGFTPRSVQGVKIPGEVLEWLYQPVYRLPWYHPLYNPCLWKKRLTREEIKRLHSCVDGLVWHK